MSDHSIYLRVSGVYVHGELLSWQISAYAKVLAKHVIFSVPYPDFQLSENLVEILEIYCRGVRCELRLMRHTCLAFMLASDDELGHMSNERHAGRGG
jgi:hypothetical protein